MRSGGLRSLKNKAKNKRMAALLDKFARAVQSLAAAATAEAKKKAVIKAEKNYQKIMAGISETTVFDLARFGEIESQYQQLVNPARKERRDSIVEAILNIPPVDNDTMTSSIEVVISIEDILRDAINEFNDIKKRAEQLELDYVNGSIALDQAYEKFAELTEAARALQEQNIEFVKDTDIQPAIIDAYLSAATDINHACTGLKRYLDASKKEIDRARESSGEQALQKIIDTLREDAPEFYKILEKHDKINVSEMDSEEQAELKTCINHIMHAGDARSIASELRDIGITDKTDKYAERIFNEQNVNQELLEELHDLDSDLQELIKQLEANEPSMRSLIDTQLELEEITAAQNEIIEEWVEGRNPGLDDSFALINESIDIASMKLRDVFFAKQNILREQLGYQPYVYEPEEPGVMDEVLDEIEQRENKAQPQKPAASSKDHTAEDMNDLLDELDAAPDSELSDAEMDALLREQDAKVQPKKDEKRDDKGKDEWVRSHADRQLDAKDTEALQMMGVIRDRARALKKNTGDITSEQLTAMLGEINGIAARAATLRQEIEALDRLEPKPDQRAYQQAIEKTAFIVEKCEEARAVIEVEQSELEHGRSSNPAGNRLQPADDDNSLTSEDDDDELGDTLEDEEDWALDDIMNDAPGAEPPPPPPPPPFGGPAGAPPPPPGPGAALPPANYFFARNQAEYGERVDQIQEIHRHFDSIMNNVKRAERVAASMLATSKISGTKYNDMVATIDRQVEDLLLYRGLLEDNDRRLRNVHTDRFGNTREAAFRIHPRAERSDILARINAINSCIAKLNAAKQSIVDHRAALAAEPAPQQFTAFYSKENTVTQCPDQNTALATAYQYVQAHNNNAAARVPAPVIHGGAAPARNYSFAAPDCEHRAILTKVSTMSLLGKREETAVAIAQSINPEKSYSRQELAIAKSDLNKVDRLPIRAQEKEKKREEQMKFVSMMVESALAAITTNGPIKVENWPKNLQAAASVYCEHMGYDFQPRTAMKPAEKTAYQASLNHLIIGPARDDAFIRIYETAQERRDAKLATTPPPRPGR